MSKSDAMEFQLPEGWTVRRVATALAREWLTPFLADTGPKAPRWVLQPIVEAPEGDAPLWEAGITTEEYERRLDREDLAWAIRASVARGRGKGTVLARLSNKKEEPGKVQVDIFQNPIPDTVFDSAKVDEFLQAHGAEGMGGLMAGLLTSEGLGYVKH